MDELNFDDDDYSKTENCNKQSFKEVNTEQDYRPEDVEHVAHGDFSGTGSRISYEDKKELKQYFKR